MDSSMDFYDFWYGFLHGKQETYGFVWISCDAPNPGCPLTTRQPAEIYMSLVTRHTHE